MSQVQIEVQCAQDHALCQDNVFERIAEILRKVCTRSAIFQFWKNNVQCSKYLFRWFASESQNEITMNEFLQLVSFLFHFARQEKTRQGHKLPATVNIRVRDRSEGKSLLLGMVIDHKHKSNLRIGFGP
jgi:hypothetical protein